MRTLRLRLPFRPRELALPRLTNETRPTFTSPDFYTRTAPPCFTTSCEACLKMRLRLTILRHRLPATEILWAIPEEQTNAATTVSRLLAQINEVIPLEAQHWGLEDYVISVDGFECLHFQAVGNVLKEGDHVVYVYEQARRIYLLTRRSIRPLETPEVRARTLCGRTQISENGQHLIDGVPFGRAYLRTPNRPQVTIPPRKRRRISEAEEDALLDISENMPPQLLLTNGEGEFDIYNLSQEGPSKRQKRTNRQIHLDEDEDDEDDDDDFNPDGSTDEDDESDIDEADEGAADINAVAPLLAPSPILRTSKDLTKVSKKDKKQNKIVHFGKEKVVTDGAVDDEDEEDEPFVPDATGTRSDLLEDDTSEHDSDSSSSDSSDSSDSTSSESESESDSDSDSSDGSERSDMSSASGVSDSGSKASNSGSDHESNAGSTKAAAIKKAPTAKSSCTQMSKGSMALSNTQIATQQGSEKLLGKTNVPN